MEMERNSSNTAKGVAVLRAVHQLIDQEPRILDDAVVTRLFDPEMLDSIRAHPERFQTSTMRGLRSHVVTRSRYAEDRLAEAHARGVRHYLSLGAGLDTFAYRQPAWAHDLRIIEIDHPASQRAKRERLAAAGIAIPPNVEFVPIDFEISSLRQGLSTSSFFDPTRPAFVSWLGVMVYLTMDASDAVFRFVASLPSSSEIVFTFAGPERPRPDEEPGRPGLADLAAGVGEPWLTRIESEDLLEHLRTFPFSSVTLLSPAEIDERYIRGRTDGLRAPRESRIMSAIV